MVLNQMFKLIYDSNNLFYLDFMTACTFFRIKPRFKDCFVLIIQFDINNFFHHKKCTLTC